MGFEFIPFFVRVLSDGLSNQTNSQTSNERGHMHTVEVDAMIDTHGHLREHPDVVAALLKLALEGGACMVGAMPNTEKGLKNAAEVLAYSKMVTDLFESHDIDPFSLAVFYYLMVTERTTPEDIYECARRGIFHGKFYPRGRTTLSERGIVRYGRMLPVVRACGECGMFAHVHPEHPSMLFDNRDAEFAFLPIARMFLEETDAKIVWEHGTDARCIPHWEDMAQSGRFFVTLTAHHLATNEDGVFGDVRGVCKPPIKTERDRNALVEFASKGYSWVMGVSDSAFHDKDRKFVEQDRCDCGALTAPFLLPLFAHVLPGLMKTVEGIKIFERLTSGNAKWNYGLTHAARRAKLVNVPQKIPLTYPVGHLTGMPFWAGRTIDWSLV